MVRPIQALTVDDAGMQDYLINWNAGPLGVVLRPDLGADMPPVVAQLLPQPSVLKLAGVREGDLLISVNGKKTTRLGYEKVVRLLFKERLPMVLHLRTPLQTTANLQIPELRRGASASIAEESADRPRGRTRASSSARPRGHRERSATEISGRDPRGRSTTTDRDLRARTTATERDPRSRITAELPPKSKKDKKKKEKGGPADERRLRKQFSVVWERGSLGLSFRAYNSKVDVPCVDFISVSRGQGRGMERVCVNDVLIAINGEKTKSLGVEKVLRWLHVIEKPVVLRFHASSNRVQGQPSDPDGLTDPAGPPDGRVRRPTLPQPEYEPMPRPPRRNNSVDHGPPPPPAYAQEQAYAPEQGYTQERVYVDGGNYDQVVGRSDGRNYEPVEMDREYEPMMVRPDVRRYSNDSAPYYEDREPQIRHMAERPTNPRRGRRSSTDSLHVVHRPLPYDDNKTMTAGDFRREPISETPPPFDLQIDARIIPHRRPPTDHHHHHNGYYQSRPERPPYQPSYQLLGGDAINHQPPASSPYKAEANDDRARPRLASRDSQASAASHLSFDEAADIVARAAGKPAADCEFGGVPLLHIQEGTVQAKLMFIYAKACVAREQDITTDGNHDQPLKSDGDGNNNGGPIKSDGEMEIPRTPGNPLGRKTHAEYLSYTILQDDALTSSAPHGRRDAPASTPMPSMSSPQTKAPPSPGPLVPEPEPSSSIVSEDGSVPPPPAAPTSPVPPTEAFISLKDFVVSGDGSLTERRTTSSLNSTVTPDPSADGDKLPEPHPTTADNSETSHDSAAEEPAPLEPEVAHPADEEPTEQSEPLADDDAVSIGSSNERELAASVASLDDLLDLPVKNHNHDDEEHEEFVDDEEHEEPTGTEEHEEPTGAEETKQKEQEAVVTAPLDMPLPQVQEEEAEETEEAEEAEKEEEQPEDGALTNPLVDELFRNVPDVREVVKDKPALVVLVKKSMIDEIQEILQSLQMELQFERHSTMGVGSMPSPPRHSRLSTLNTEGKHCFRCDAVGELAELTLAGGRRELYCQECWELFFFSEDRQSPVAAGKELAPSEASRLTADEDALDEALKYSFHDSSVTREDMIHPWRYLQGSDSMSSIRDSATSNNSSITDRTDEVWL